MADSKLPIATTGATGNLGGRVALALADQGTIQRMLVRDLARAPVLMGATTAAFSYGDKRASVTALRGLKVLFMVSASESADRLERHQTFIDAAAEAGIEHIVYTSFAGAAQNATFTLARDHWATEEHIRASGMTYTLLRDNFYIDFLPALAGTDGVIRGPAGEGRVAAVCREDIGRVAVAVLNDPDRHANATYDLSGPEALTLTEVGAVISAVTGRVTSFYDESLEEARTSRQQWDPPPWQMDAWISTYVAIADGSLQQVTTVVEDLTARRPLSLRDFLIKGA